MPVTAPPSSNSTMTVEEQNNAIHDALEDPLDEQWKTVLSEWDGGTTAQRRAIRAYVSGVRNRIVQTLDDLEEVNEIRQALAVQYLEMKCHWTLLNTQIQSQTARDGVPDEALMYRATCVSLIIQAIEPLLSQERINTLTQMLAEPIE
ncbi:MAG: hypothetical protein R6U20_12235 [Longimonas sp.]|uniref:hypothetical protein n=1 Tax=Longimonas sp. TaxID=2039626 RepID=UPI003976C207